MTQRTLVIGDIHGALKALIQLLDRINLRPTDKLIFLGDYVDGWSQSAQVIDYLMQLEKSHECIFIKGNHDAWCEDWLRDGMVNEIWQRHGGKQTIASYEGFEEDRLIAHAKFFRGLQNFYIDERHRLYIHAGFSSMHGPENEHYTSNFSWDRTLWEMALTMDRRIKADSKLYPKRLLLYHEIYIGHTPTLYYDFDVPMQGCNVWNIDTGAAFYGKLSAMDADSKQVWQSDTVQHLYPNEKGRN